MKKQLIACPKCRAKNGVPVFKQHLAAKCGRCATPLDISAIIAPIELFDNDFNEFIEQAPLPVLVDFYSPTCGPCKMLAPVLDQLAKRHFKRLLLAKVDTSRNQRCAMQYRIRGVPTLIFFRNGRPVHQMVGALPAHELDQQLETLLAG